MLTYSYVRSASVLRVFTLFSALLKDYERQKSRYLPL